MISSRWFGRIVLAALAATVGYAWNANAQQAPAGTNAVSTSLDEHSDAYVMLVKADQARDQQDWRNAVTNYRNALTEYAQLARSQPDWQPDIVQYRISYCKNEIEAIVRETGKPEKDWLAQPETAPAADTDREKYLALLQENQYLKKRTAELEEEMARVEAEVAKTNASQIESSTQSVALATMPAPGGATNELAALRDELRRVQAESEALRHAAASNETTAAAYDILKTHVAQLEQENQELAARPAGPAAPAAPTATVAPVDAISLNLLRTGLAQEQLGNYASALAVYERAPAAGSNAAEVVKAKSRCLINLGRVDSAIDQLQTLITEQPKDSQAKVLLAIAFCRNRQFSNAIEILVPLATENPSDALAQSALGAAYMGLGNTDAAATALRKAVELDPANADAQFNLAQLLAESPRDVDQARAHYKQFLEAGGAHDPALDKALGVAP